VDPLRGGGRRRDAGEAADGVSGRPAGWRRFLRLWRPNTEADIDAELRFHFEQKVAGLVARGATPDVARAQAVAEFGDVDAVRSSLREIDGRIEQHRQRAEWWESIAQDVGYVLRSLRRSPGFTVMVSVTLALGIGVNAALFSVLDRLYLRPPPGVGDPAHVRRAYQQYKDKSATEFRVRSVFSAPELRRLAAAAPKGVSIAGYYVEKEHFGRGADAPEAISTYVVGDYFGVLGVRPALGRFFAPDEHRLEGLSAVAVIGHRMWMDRFGGTRDALGATVDLGSRRYTIVGVAPANFLGVDLNASDLWLPVNTQGPWKGRKPEWYAEERAFDLKIAARVPSNDAARALTREATAAFSKTEAVRDSNAVATLPSISEALDSGFGGKQLMLATRLGGVAAIVLLIACANVANLLLARGTQRRREIAVRLALGVSRRRLVTLLLAESVVIALIAGGAAMLVALWTATALRRGLLPDVSWGELAINGRVAAFAAGIAVLSGVAAGLAPALQSSRLDITTALRGSAREGTYQRSRLRTGLLVTQAALSLVLIAAAGLLVRSLHGVETVDTGYAAHQLLFASVGFDPELDDHAKEISDQLPAVADRLRRLPEVEGVALSSMNPMRGFGYVDLFLPDRDSVPKLNGFPPLYSSVTPEFFATTGVRVLSGRGLTADDREGSEPVIVVSELTARMFWPGQNAVGKCIVFKARTEACRRVVGVVTNTHVWGIVEKPSMAVYTPLAQSLPGWRRNAINIRAKPGATARVAARVRQALAQSFGSWALPRIRTMSELLDDELRPWRLGAALFTAAGLLALLVAAVGVYGTLAYAISQRKQEMSVRIALGAQSTHILRLVVGEGLRAVVAGVVLGAVVALALGRVVASMLYNTSPHDPTVLAISSLILLGVAIVACLVPAWRATRADPATALRAE
jgi:putative ABC transport system permease protein